MAKDNKENKDLKKIQSDSSLLVYGVDTTLDDEDIAVRNIIKQTLINTKTKFGSRTGNKPINYFNEITFGNNFFDFVNDKKTKNESQLNPEYRLKQLMTDGANFNAAGLLFEEGARLTAHENYRTIYNHIPECAQALHTVKDNIMSPDDFTKLIFNIDYNNELDEDTKEEVEKVLKRISEKYELEDLSDKIIEESLKLGESFVAVLSLENELNFMLSDEIFGSVSLNESLNGNTFRKLDETCINVDLSKDMISLNEQEIGAFSSLSEGNLTEDNIKDEISKIVNNNITIGSKKELLLEKIEADRDFKAAGVNIPGSNILDEISKQKNTRKNKKETNKPLGLNGSVVKYLDPSKVVELKIENTCYGYYYIEETNNSVASSFYLGASSGRSTTANTTLSANSTVASTTATTYTPNNDAANNFNIGEQKLRLISDTFLSAISKKLNKDFVRKNKEMKDFIYELVKQEYIIKKGVKITYFLPNEVIKFDVEPLYKNIVFFAKLYLSALTNDLLVKLGRSHDKRIFYVNTGIDANYEQAINKVIQDIKAKDYKMDNLMDFNTILRLNPGRWDDYYMPVINGDRPIDIDTLPGMDVEINNEFTEFLKNSMLAGMGVPRGLIDSMAEIDFARTVSSQNANFVRSIIRYQKKFTTPFTRLFRELYKNENKFISGEKTNIEKIIDIDSIFVSFPSPASLAMNNLTDQITAADQNAEFIASQLLPPISDGSNEDARINLKAEIVKDLVPGVAWEKYKNLMKKMKLEKVKSDITKPLEQNDDMTDTYSQY